MLGIAAINGYLKIPTTADQRNQPAFGHRCVGGGPLVDPVPTAFNPQAGSTLGPTESIQVRFGNVGYQVAEVVDPDNSAFKGGFIGDRRLGSGQGNQGAGGDGWAQILERLPRG